MLFGTPEHFHIQCNEDSLSQGCDRNRNPHVTIDTLPAIQQLIFDNRIIEAQKKIKMSLTGLPEFQRIYEPAAKVGRSQWQDILDRHIEDYTRLYTSTSLELSQTSVIKSVPQLMKEAEHGHLDNYLTELMFNYRTIKRESPRF